MFRRLDEPGEALTTHRAAAATEQSPSQGSSTLASRQGGVPIPLPNSRIIQNQGTRELRACRSTREWPGTRRASSVCHPTAALAEAMASCASVANVVGGAGKGGGQEFGNAVLVENQDLGHSFRVSVNRMILYFTTDRPISEVPLREP